MNKRNRTVWKTLIGSTLAIVLLCAAGGAAFADSSNTPQAITSDAPVAGTITGGGAGSFTYYTFNYPGGDADVRVQVTFASVLPWGTQDTGFNVYGWNGFSGQGVQQDEGYMELSYAATDPVTMEIQVYNYDEGLAVPYSVKVTGLATEQATVATTATTTTETAASTAATTQTASNELVSEVKGALTGNGGGAFATYTLAYDGDDSIVYLTLWMSAADPYGAFGFNVWCPDGSLAGTSAQTAYPNYKTASLQSDVAGQYTIQIYNYLDGVTTGYDLVAK